MGKGRSLTVCFWQSIVTIRYIVASPGKKFKNKDKRDKCGVGL